MKPLLPLLLVAALAGCDARSSLEARQDAQAVAGADADLQPIPGDAFTFVARKSSGAIWFYRVAYNADPQVKGTILFAPPVPK